MDINFSIISGRLTATPEIKKTPSNKSVATFTVAVNTGFGENAKVNYIDCVAWEKTAEFIGKYFNKGSAICVEGRTTTRTWEDTDGKKHKAVELIVNEAHFMGGKEDKPATAMPTTAKPELQEILVEDDALPFE